MEDMDYKEIKKQHSEMMNTEIKQTHQSSHIGYNNYTPLQPKIEYKPYYFDFSLSDQSDKDSEGEEYKTIEIKYVIPGTQSKSNLYLGIIKVKLKINQRLAKSYGEFYSYWKECLDNQYNLYWYNEKQDKSTWENPLFILLSLFDNRINTEWVPLYWDSLHEKIIKIYFSNKKILFLNKIDKV